jgi:RHS repeat-associated protein
MAADHGGDGGNGKVILTYTSSASSTGNTVQYLNYSYDALGNITQIVDLSNTANAKTTYYTYDTLSRLLTASTTGATTTPDYKYTYAYDLLGNITSGPLGSYGYAGNTGSNYANPDAVTSLATKTLTYDNNGNLTALGTTTYSWNYRNRLTQSGSGLATSTYGYDDQDARVWLKEGNTKTIFPNALYNVVLGTTTATSTKHIMIGDLLVATVENVGTTTTSTTTPVITTRFAVTDHLGSVSAILTASGTVAEMIDAFPYGGQRLDVKSGSYIGEKNKYAQTQYDATANLNYAQARYEDGVRGQFLSQDPVFWTNMNIADPQSMNAYSYTDDNPIVFRDPSGRSLSDYVANPVPDGGFGYGAPMATYNGVTIFSHGDRDPLAVNNSWQCVNFVQRYSSSQFDASFSENGDAVMYGSQTALNSTMVRNSNSGLAIAYANGGSVMPAENDMMTWSDNGGAGHVGIVVEVDFNAKTGQGTVYTAEQNFRRNQALFQQTITRSAAGNYTVAGRAGYQVQGWTRYGSVVPGSVSQGGGSTSGGYQSVLSSLSSALHSLQAVLSTYVH